MDKIVQLNAQTGGRDKLARLLQYLSKVIWYRLQQSNKDGVNTLKNLEFQLSTFRKVLRFGKCIDTVYSVFPLFNNEDHIVKITVILGKLSNAIFLLADHILWLGRSDLYAVDTDKWNRICSQYWLYSLSMNLLRDLYEIFKILKIYKNEIIPAKGVHHVADVMKITSNACTYLQKHPEVMVDVIKNSADVFIPLTALGYLRLSPGTTATFGVISSIAGLIVLLRPCKLSP